MDTGIAYLPPPPPQAPSSLLSSQEGLKLGGRGIPPLYATLLYSIIILSCRDGKSKKFLGVDKLLCIVCEIYYHLN